MGMQYFSICIFKETYRQKADQLLSGPEVVEGLTIMWHKGTFQGVLYLDCDIRTSEMFYILTDSSYYTLKIGVFYVSYAFKKLI